MQDRSFQIEADPTEELWSLPTIELPIRYQMREGGGEGKEGTEGDRRFIRQCQCRL